MRDVFIKYISNDDTIEESKNNFIKLIGLILLINIRC